MEPVSTDAAFFVAGGTVPPGSPSYVERGADREILDALLAGEFCFVLNSRQMGKSSLAVRTIARLTEAGVGCAFVDLTRVGGATVTPDQWYAGLLLETGRALGLRSEAAAWLKGHRDVGPAQRLLSFLHEDALARVQGPVVLMLDEIDAVRSLGFSTDELFAGLRQLHNGRASDPALRRLTVCLLGAALPSDLVRDPRTTPFNVGRRIELRDFTREEARPFERALGAATLARLLHWTGGHPFLTQALGAELAGGGDVDALVRSRYLEVRARDSDTNLSDVARRLLGEGDPSVDDAARADALSLYERMLRGKAVADDEANPSTARIKMSGVARVENGLLKPRNRIYAAAFDSRWVRENMPGQELQRQRKAFWKGALRTGAISLAVVATTTTLAAAAYFNAVEARKERDRANGQTLLATSEATRANENLLRADREAKRATAQTKVARWSEFRAKQSAKVAERRRLEALKAQGDAERATSSALAAKRSESAAKGVALRSATEAERQRRIALGQTNRVLESQKSLKAELYDNAIQSLQALWEKGDRAEMAKVLAAAPTPKGRGWEWGYWRRLSNEARVGRVGPSARYDVPPSSFVPSEGAGIVFYTTTGRAADLVDDRTGKTLRRFWRLPELKNDYYRAAFSRNGRWAVRDDSKRHLVLHDLARGTTRPLPAAEGEIVDGVGDDGGRYATHVYGRGKDSEVTVWDSVRGRPLFVRRPPAPLGFANALDPDGKTLLMRYGDESSGRLGIAEYDVERGAIGKVYALPTSPGSGRERYAKLVFASEDALVARIGDKVAVFRRGDPEPRFALAPTDFRGGLSVSRDGRFLLSTQLDGDSSSAADKSSGKIWDLRTGSLVGSLPLSGGVLSGDGRRIVTLENEETRTLDWREASPYRETTVLRARQGSRRAPSPSGASEPYDRLSLDEGSVLATAYETAPRSANGGYRERVLSYTRYDLEGRVLARYPSAGEVPPTESAYTQGNYLGVAKGRRFEVRRLRDFRLVRTLEIEEGDFPFVSADPRRVASINGRGVLRVWMDAPTPVARAKTRFSTPSAGHPSGLLETSPDGAKILVFGTSEGFEIRDSRSLRLLLTSAPGERDLFYGTWIDPSTLRFESDANGHPVLYDLVMKKRRPAPPQTFRGFQCFSPDGRLRAGIVGDGTIEIRSTRSDRRLLTLDAAAEAPPENAPAPTISGVQFSKDGRSLNVLYSNGWLRTYQGDF